MKAPKCRFLYALVLGVVLAASPPALAETFTVFPSDDPTGVADHANIQSAMDSAAAGSTVKLAAGNFYVNQGIVVEGFNGTLRGTLGRNDEEVLTTLEAVAPFLYSHAWGYFPDNLGTPTYDDRIMPSVIFFEFPEREITVRDLIFVANAPAYVDPRPMWGNPNPDWDTTALTHFIGDFGNDVDATYRNLTFIAGVGDYLGSNVAAAIHSMRGPGCSAACARVGEASLHGIGNAVFKHIRASNVSDYVIVPMWYKNGTIDVEDVVSDVGAAVTVWGAMEMTVKVTDVESNDSWRSLVLSNIYGGKTRVRRLNSVGGVSPAVYIYNAENIDIRDSILSGANGFGEWWRAAVYIRRYNRNITLVDNAFVEMTGVPMAVFALPGWGTTGVFLENNYYDPDNFPGDPDFAIVLGSDDSRVVEPSLQPDQVLDLGVNNTIKLGGL
ncbi:MAG: hypothetical protein V3R81_06510 [Gammaproteobacteria bacterium]